MATKGPKFKPNEYKYINNQTIEIQLSQGKTCLIDTYDYDLVKMHRWYYAKLKKSNTGYVVASVQNNDKRITLQMHRLIMSVTNDKYKCLDIDHINREGTDNRRSNLRICTRSQNQMNKIKNRNNTTGYKGVYFKKDRNKFIASIRFNKKNIHIGYYYTPKAAAAAYDVKAKELFGEFANTNFK
jgi:hypothetical protein